jgi:hypothetical protein
MQMPRKDVEIAVVQSMTVKVVEQGEEDGDEMEREGQVPVAVIADRGGLRRRAAYGEGMVAKERRLTIMN